MIVRRIGVLTLGKILGAIYGALGLVFGLILSLVSLLGFAFGSAMEQAQNGADAAFAGLAGVLFGVGAVVVLPIFYGIMGFLVGLLIAAIYNVAARTIGGVELELE